MLMSNQKKQIIVNEIVFWKQNKLLPDHYCDFLMTLYTEGNNESEEIKGSASQAIKAKEQRKNRSRFLFIPMAAIALLVLLFTIELVWLLAVIVGIAGIACVVAAIYFAKKNNVIAPILQLTAALLFLGLSVKVYMAYFDGNNTALYGLLAANCLLWLLSGTKLKLLYFTISGALGLVVMVGYWFFNM